MKYKLFICFLLIINKHLNSQELGYINDSDGYTNIRKEATIRSEVIGIIIEGQEFHFFQEKNNQWFEVEINGLKGYVHSSKIISEGMKSDEIHEFYLDFYNLDKNNAEYSESNNEKLFEYILRYPHSSIIAFKRVDKFIQDFLLSEIETPINDLIDLKLIINKLIILDKDKNIKDRIIIAINKARKKMGDTLQLNTEFRTPVINIPQKNPRTNK